MAVSDIENTFTNVRAKAAEGQIVIVRPDGQFLWLRPPSKHTAPPQIVAAVERMIPPTPKRNVAVVAFAGLRNGEVRGLVPTDDLGENIAIHRSVWHNVVKEQCKTASSGTEPASAMIPVIAPLRGMLDAIKPFKSGWMFPNRCGGVLDLDNFATRIIRPLLKKAGSPWYGWQAYRRGLASNLKALGIDDMVIPRVLRHSDVSTTQRNYIRVRDEKMHDAMLQLGLAFDACTAFVQSKDTPPSVN